jgi:hypothetical protein
MLVNFSMPSPAREMTECVTLTLPLFCFFQDGLEEI